MTGRLSATDDLARAKLLAAVDAAQRVLDEARALLGVADAAHAAAIPAPRSEPDWSPEWGTLQQAATILQRSSETCVKIIRRNGLGAFTDGRWRVDLARCHAYCEGRPYPPMAGACLR